MKISDSSLDTVVARYLTVRRALGREYSNEARVLSSLSRFVREQNLDDLQQGGFDAWCESFASLNAIHAAAAMESYEISVSTDVELSLTASFPTSTASRGWSLIVQPSSLNPLISPGCWPLQHRSSVPQKVR
jgi:hypothetical protein